MSKPLAIDLFCGLGGWTDGLLAEGYDVIGFDIERHDYGEGMKYPAQLVLQDVMTIHGKQFKDASLIVASSPCQKYSYMAMPWTRAKDLAKWYRESPERLAELNALFEQPARIQREACEHAGHFIPMVQENVRGAIPWVGRSRWNYGSFHLWGDVPALMPMTQRAVMKAGVAHRADGSTNFHGDKNYGQKVPGFRFDGSGKSFQTASVEGTKNTGGSWFNIAHNTTSGKGQNPDGRKLDGVTGYERDHPNALGWPKPGTNSKSKARKAASAAIAKIPLPLARHIARSWYPQECAA